jgi:hypothetical protein
VAPNVESLRELLLLELRAAVSAHLARGIGPADVRIALENRLNRLRETSPPGTHERPRR